MSRRASDLGERVALVTGAAHRVGRAIAIALAHAGASIALHFHESAEHATNTMREIENIGVAAASFRANLADVPNAERLIHDVVAHYDRLDILICNAGMWHRTPMGHVTQEQWDTLFAINARAPFFLTQAAVPHLRRERGCLVMITDSMLASTWPDHTPYLASKAALAMLIPGLARDLAPDIRVNGVAPGPVLLPDNARHAYHDAVARTTLLEHWGTAEDVADAVCYLIHAPFVTGTTLTVDGGQRWKRTISSSTCPHE